MHTYIPSGNHMLHMWVVPYETHLGPMREAHVQAHMGPICNPRVSHIVSDGLSHAGTMWDPHDRHTRKPIWDPSGTHMHPI